MISHIRILFFLLAFVPFLAGNAVAGNPEEALAKLLESPSLTPDKTTILVYELGSGKVLAAHNETAPITPASVMKCVTVAALKNRRQYKTRIETPIYYTGKIANNVITGNLIVEGAGDPSVNNGRHPGDGDIIEEIVTALTKKGVKAIEGQILIDNAFFAGSPVPSSWETADLSQSYGTGCHAFNFEGNASGKKAVNNPGNVFVKKLSDALAAKGITVNGNAYDSSAKKTLLAKHQSALLGNLMRSCMFRSDNLYAETFLRLFGKEGGGNGSVEDSAEAASLYWEQRGYPVEWVKIVDGSGLSRSNRLTADFLSSVLERMAIDPVYVSFFPLTGEEGTVRSFLSDTRLSGYMALKTGSMNGIQSYAGYKLDEDYEPTHVVVVMSNNLKNRDQFRKDLTTFFLSIF